MDSIGILYSVVTLHLGFDFNSDEYKIMGLAPYGDPAKFRPFFDEAVQRLPDGRIQIPLLRMNRSREDREGYGATRRHLEQHLIACRQPDSEITDEHRDVAAALQECLDQVMLHICQHAGQTTGLRRLALAGGVALNCTANGKLLRSGLFDEIYIQPAAADDGSALGAACGGHRGTAHFATCGCQFRSWDRLPRRRTSTRPWRSSRDGIDVRRFATLGDACREGSQIDSRRACGRLVPRPHRVWPAQLRESQHPGRSRNPQMRDHINALVKMREAFRPFAGPPYHSNKSTNGSTCRGARSCRT